jgi:hypothetical protein
MKKHLFALGMATAVLIAGCDGTMPTGQQDKPLTPGSTSSAAPTTGTSTGSDPFVAGRKWTYGITTKAAMLNTSGDMTLEVADLTADKATIKTTVTIAGVTNSNTTTVDRKASNPWASMDLSGSGTGTSVTAAGDETITVTAGSFPCTKYTATINQAPATGTVDFWLNKDKGLIKEIVTTKVNVAANLPAGMAMPGGLSTDMTTTTTIELKSVTP